MRWSVAVRRWRHVSGFSPRRFSAHGVEFPGQINHYVAGQVIVLGIGYQVGRNSPCHVLPVTEDIVSSHAEGERLVGKHGVGNLCVPKPLGSVESRAVTCGF